MMDVRDVPVFAGMSSGVLDSPGRMSVTAFVPVCNLRCPYCYNKAIIGAPAVFSLNDVLGAHAKIHRFAATAGVTLSGGEPTAHKLFGDIIGAIPAGVHVTVHTNGIRVSEALAKRADAVIVSVKTPDDGCGEHKHDAVAATLKMLAAYAGVHDRILRCVTSDDTAGRRRKDVYDRVAEYAVSRGWVCETIPCIDPETQTRISVQEKPRWQRL